MQIPFISPKKMSPDDDGVSSEEPGSGKPRPIPFKKFIKNLLCTLRLRRDSSFDESVAELIEEQDTEGTPLHPEERTILTNIIGFKQLRLEDVMVPRSDIAAIGDDISLEDLRKVVIDKEHTRMPVYHETLDNIRGFIHTKDLIRYLGAEIPFSISEILREIPVVPPSMLVIDLLMKMRASRVHIAMVVDEHGGTDGLVTIEDLVEEIVGEIEDEHDTHPEQAVKVVAEGRWEIIARLPIEDLEKELGMAFVTAEEKNDFDTVGGLIFALAGRIPATGEIISHPSGVQFKILEAEPRRVKKVLVQKNNSA